MTKNSAEVTITLAQNKMINKILNLPVQAVAINDSAHLLSIKDILKLYMYFKLK